MRRLKLKTYVISFLLILIFFSSWGILNYKRQTIFNYLVFIKTPRNPVDSIYVFCGSLKEYLWRVEAAAEAYRKFSAKEIILFDDGMMGPWDIKLKKNLSAAEWGARIFMNAGIDPDRIIILKKSIKGTMGEAEAIKKTLSKRSTRSVLLVTSPYHLRRVFWSLKTITDFPLEIYTYTFDPSRHDNLMTTGNLLFEFTKIIAYRLIYA